MSDTIDDGGPAFPIVGGGGDSRLHEDYGMSLRDWFAGQALAGMNASLIHASSWPHPETITLMAANAYAQADAMLQARKAERTGDKP